MGPIVVGAIVIVHSAVCGTGLLDDLHPEHALFKQTLGGSACNQTGTGCAVRTPHIQITFATHSGKLHLPCQVCGTPVCAFGSFLCTNDRGGNRPVPVLLLTKQQRFSIPVIFSFFLQNQAFSPQTWCRHPSDVQPPALLHGARPAHRKGGGALQVSHPNQPSRSQDWPGPSASQTPTSQPPRSPRFCVCIPHRG